MTVVSGLMLGGRVHVSKPFEQLPAPDEGAHTLND